MKLFIFALALTLVPAASSFAQTPNEKDKPKREPPPQEQPKRPEQPDRERQQDRDKPPQDREKQDRDRRDKDQQQREKQQKGKDNERQDRNRVQQGQASSRDRQSAEHAGHGGRRIPEERFRASFGPEHRFHVHPQSGGDRVAGGQGQRFQYAGYWIEFVEPWPSAWSYDDDCYIDYIDDDYYLFDEMHPGYRVLIIFVE